MPAAIELGIAVLALAAMLFSYAALKGYQYSFKPILIQLGQIFNAIRLPGRFPFVGGSHLLGGLGDWFINLAQEVEKILAGFYLTSEGAVGYLWDQLAKQARWLGQELAALADTTDRAIGRIIATYPPAAAMWLATKATRDLPHAVEAVIHPVTHELRALVAGAEAEVATVEQELARLGRGIDRTVKQLGGKITKEGAVFGATVGGLAGSIGLAWTWIQRLRHVLTKQGAAALVGTALATLGLGFLRCPRFAKAGRQVCGMNAGLLDALLADALLIASTLSIVTLAEAVLAAEGEIVSGLQRTVKELKGVQALVFEGYSGVVDGKT